MRLKTIIEDITKREFFDFYALLYAHQNDRNDEIVTRHLSFLTGQILNDHLNQIAQILFNRLIDPDHQETAEILDTYNIISDDDGMQTILPDSLSLSDKADIIKRVVPFNHHHGFTGSTWVNLGREFVSLCNTAPGLNSQVSAIDRLYNMMHHGGLLADYMDERRWLEDALNYRDNANPAQIFRQASPEVRAIVGRSSYSGQNHKNVSDIDKLFTACRRIENRYPGMTTQVDKDILEIAIKHRMTYWTDSGRMTPCILYGDEPNKSIETLINRNMIKLGESAIARVKISDTGRTLTITTSGQSKIIEKPIKQFRFIENAISDAMIALYGHSI